MASPKSGPEPVTSLDSPHVAALIEWLARMQRRNEALRILFEEVVLDVREHKLWVNPRPAFAGLFEARAAWVKVGHTPARTRTVRRPSGLYLPEELIGRVA